MKAGIYIRAQAVSGAHLEGRALSDEHREPSTAPGCRTAVLWVSPALSSPRTLGKISQRMPSLGRRIGQEGREAE